MTLLSRRLVAEAVGTFALVFIGVAVVVVSGGFPDSGSGLLGVALATATVYAVMVSATIGISGGHLNPAVTIAMLVTRRIEPLAAIGYIVAQIAAGVLAAALVQALLPSGMVREALAGAPIIADVVSLNQAIAIEAVLTFFLVSAVFGTAVSPEGPPIGGFGIGLVLLFDMLVGAPLTGGVVNPARAFGPALVGGQWVGHIVWWVGPIAGAILAALLWEHVLLPRRARPLH